MGAGEDGLTGGIHYDFNAGADGNLFTLRAEQDFCGYNCDGRVRWSLSGIEFWDRADPSLLNEARSLNDCSKLMHDARRLILLHIRSS